MIANISNSYLRYLNKLTDDNTYHRSIGKKAIHTDCSVLIEEIELSLKVPKFESVGRVRITKYKNIFSKVYTKHWSKEVFITHCVLKTNPCTCKIKNLICETMNGSFYEKELLLRKF